MRVALTLRVFVDLCFTSWLLSHFGGRRGNRTHSNHNAENPMPCPRFELGIYMFEILDYSQFFLFLK